jgi:hypothetical protein
MDNVLKKDFDKRAVQRVRNIINNKLSDSTGIQVGYKRESEDRVEGVPFEENGKTWIILDGIKQTVTKLDEFKKLAIIPLLCPSCSSPLKTEYDKKMYNIHKKCMDCVSKFETELKINGKFKEYSDAMIKGNIDHFLKDYEEFLADAYNNLAIKGHITEDGVIEKWIGNNKNAIIDAQEQLKIAKKSQSQ